MLGTPQVQQASGEPGIGHHTALPHDL